jgi:short-subunit dehydrogenase
MKKAVIIGASSGIGKELAIRMASMGWKVCTTGRRTLFLEELGKMNPDAFISRTMDVTDTESLPGQLEEIASSLGGIDMLILSSGTGDINDSLDFSTEKRTINTNVTGFTCISDWSFNYFKKHGSGHLVIISSIGGLRGSSSAPAYNASKAYQINYLEGLRQKVYREKLPIYVTDIRPGLVNTDMAKGEGLFWVMPVEKAAKQILTAIRRKKRYAYVTHRWGLLARLVRLIPGRIYEKM